MSTSIQSLGVGSGLDLNTLLTQLRTAENAPLAALQTRADKESARFTGYGTLKNALDTVSSAAANLGKSETFNAVKTSVTGETFTATAKAGSGAIAGNYAISVQNLAQAQVLSSGGVADRKAQLGGGEGMIDITFTLDNDETHTLSVDAAKSSLEDIVKAINADSKLGVSATLMDDGSDTPHRLMISADQTGTENSVASISVNAAAGSSAEVGNLQSVLSYNTPAVTDGLNEIVEAKNANITINGIAVTSQTNTLENSIEGVTLTLTKQAAEGSQPDTLRLTRDDTATTTAVKNFVNAYNALQSTITALTSYDIDAQKGAALTGDSLARRAQSQVRAAFSGLAENGITLSSIGITTDSKTGNLQLDETKFTEALKTNRAEIEQLFSKDTGLSKRVTSAVEVFTKSDGLIKTSQNGIERTLKLLEGQYENMQERINQKMETYRLQFVQLDTFMAQMNSTSSYLNTQLSMLENLTSGKQK